MSGAVLHAIFDIAAWLAAFAAVWWLSRVRGLQFPSQSFELPYIAVLVFGAGLGAYLFGTLNLVWGVSCQGSIVCWRRSLAPGRGAVKVGRRPPPEAAR